MEDKRGGNEEKEAMQKREQERLGSSNETITCIMKVKSGENVELRERERSKNGSRKEGK